MVSVASLFDPVEADLQELRQNLTNLVGAQHPVLGAAAEHLFTARGKGIRPAIVLLASRATAVGGHLTPRHRRLAEITEMIHTASLVHDDVIDAADLRRGVATVNSDYGNRIAVLAGDFLFAQSSWYLANLDNLEVVKLLSKVIKDFAEGEIRQNLTQFDPDLSFEAYLDKSFYKTASLMAGSARAAAVLSETSATIADSLYEYGRSLGIAFQIVDDLLDFTSSTETLGKPAGSDLSQGNLTAPVLFAMEEKPQLRAAIEREFSKPGDLEQALQWVADSSGLERSHQLAKQFASRAEQQLQVLSSSESKDSLINLTDYVLARLK
ncbi:solanesyl diphosphate synthase [Synechococcus sp. PCC 7336]|uniref:solanesyl diphosphate synthase n=1 Tax=Synechococcus sp. PCC 7336 TaxID=195250 RepID=UPI0003448E35|nr:solanesyl diphosphate synthase [Synechococcus sp. PCC 7336]